LSNKDISHDDSITTINASIGTLQTADIIHDGQITYSNRYNSNKYSN
jgi:hypothetical protein